MLQLINNYFKSAFIDIENLNLKKQFCLQVGFIIFSFLGYLIQFEITKFFLEENLNRNVLFFARSIHVCSSKII